MLETSIFVHGSAMRSLSLMMNECPLSERGQGHVSNFCIVDLKNFATASRRYTGDIHNSSVVDLKKVKTFKQEQFSIFMLYFENSQVGQV